MSTKIKEKPIEEVSMNTNLNTPDTNNKKPKIKNCFVITPIGGENEPIRRHIDGVYDAAIVPVLKDSEYIPEIPHRLSMPGSINKQIIQKIYDSDLIIANLTNINPNVMYELALRHCFNKPAIIIAEEGTCLPFDINNERTIFYVNDAQGIIDLRNKLKKVISEIQTEKYNSPVVSILGELKFEEHIMTESTKSKEDNYARSLQMILNRLDRIESDTRALYLDERNLENRFKNRIYRIYDENSSESLNGVLEALFESLKTLGVKYKYRMIDKNHCDIEFYYLSPSKVELVENELDTFCVIFGLNNIKIS